MPQIAIFPQTRDLLISQKMTTKTLFFHSPSPFPSNFRNCNSGGICTASQFNFHCYTQHEATPTQKSVRKWHCDLLQHLAQKITKGTHLCKPASLNCPINTILKLHQNLSCHEISPHMSQSFWILICKWPNTDAKVNPSSTAHYRHDENTQKWPCVQWTMVGYLATHISVGNRRTT